MRESRTPRSMRPGPSLAGLRARLRGAVAVPAADSLLVYQLADTVQRSD